jgi:hypothetical protein
MKPLFALLVTAVAAAQQATTPPASGASADPQQSDAPAQSGDAAKPKDQTAPANAASQPAPPAPSGEPWLTGSIETGYRWVTAGGSFPAYRSIVNLGDGPKLISLDFTMLDPKHRLFDRLSARANGWGGDPYNTAHLDSQKRGLWALTADYRNIAYFNALPSFANPFAPGGIDEQSFDTHRRTGYVNLRFFPGKRIQPYATFERNSGYGHGVSLWAQDANDEFAVPTMLNDSTNNYHAGVRFEFSHYHVTLEQGGTTFREDDEASFNGIDGLNYGNRTTPLLGNTLYLNTLQQAYGIRGSSLYSKVLATADPLPWISFSGQFLWSEPKTEANYFDNATGNFVMLSALLLYPAQSDISNSNANAPHVLANAGFEARPWRPLRIIESWTTDRYHGAGLGALAEQIPIAGAIDPTYLTTLSTLQIANYNQEEVNAILDVNKKVTFRVGYRYVWGDATVRAGQFDPAGPLRNSGLQSNVALAGFTIRPWEKLLLHADYEGASTNHNYFRTSLYDYNRMRAQASYQATNSLGLQANFSLFDNQNAIPGVRYDFRARNDSLTIYWNPNAGKRVTVMAEYDRSSLYSSIDFLTLPFYTEAVSIYRENGHTGLAAVDIFLPTVHSISAKLTVGGSLIVSSGTRPTQYYQPLARLSVPVYKHVQWTSEWRWYGFGENFYEYEAFRAHTFMTGIRIDK